MTDRDALEFLGSAAELLSGPDPGPTPFVVEDLLVENGIGALVGPYKRGKTFLLLDMAICVASGREMFGSLAVKQGPVIVILEESGERALHRRLALLTRGRAVPVGEVADLHYAANKRVRLDDSAWRQRLLVAAEQIKPRLIVLDPLVRLKGIADENSQKEMAPVLDFIRDLRETSGGAVVFSQHTGHEGPGRMRGTSDLEGYWESKLTLSAEPGAATATLCADHREAESGIELKLRRNFDETTESLRLELIEDKREDLAEVLLSAIRFKPGRSGKELARAVHKRPEIAVPALRNLEAAGNCYRSDSEYRDAAGRVRRKEGWFPTSQSDSLRFPNNGNRRESEPPQETPVPASPPFKGDADGIGDSGPSHSGGCVSHPEGPVEGCRYCRTTEAVG